MKTLLIPIVAVCLSCGPAADLDATGAAPNVAVEPSCGPDTCAGCCDAYGQCQPSGDTHCGLNGAACLECLGQSYCGELGACVAAAAMSTTPAPGDGIPPEKVPDRDRSQELCRSTWLCF